MKRPRSADFSPFSRRPLPLAAALMFGALAPLAAQAQDDDAVELDAVTVTATRRDVGVQDVPLNITAVTASTIEQQKLEDLADLVKLVPGLYLVDQGGRDSNLLTVRGLNVSSLSASEGVGIDGGGVVAQYIGDIPLYVDMKLLDIERVEALLGPQGTLYGAGTLGGAIRYIPTAPQMGVTSVELSGGAYGMEHSDGVGAEGRVIANLPVNERIAVRLAANYQDDPGFIDYNYLVREMGVSDPEPQLDDADAVAANLQQDKDANDLQTFTGRASLRAQATDAVSATMSYHYQRQESGGRTVNHMESFGTDEYTSAYRVPEPNDRAVQLLSMEVVADFGFATLTSATGFSDYTENGQRDQTDLLLSFEYGYEDFPQFTAYTHETQDQNRINQEIRLVSNGDEALSWIVGAFYNSSDTYATSAEYAPGIPDFFGVVRPDNLEYFQQDFDTFSEKALFGEVGYKLTPQWNVTVGTRWFEFADDAKTGFALPLIDGSAPDRILLDSSEASVSDNDSIYKFNTDYRFTRNLLAYATVSEGYRVGGANPVPPCPNPIPPGQNVCALPNEQLILPDKTRNYELGMHSKWLDGRLLLNGDVYYIEWSDIQVAGSTVNGAIPITVNAGEAISQGLELSGRFRFSSAWALAASYSHNESELTQNASGIVSGANAYDGDRLPGSPQNQGNVTLFYNHPFSKGLSFDADYGVYAQSDVYTRVGLRNGGEILGGYAIHNASMALSSERWTVQLYAKNLLDKYAETGVRSTRDNIRAIDTAADTDNGDGFKLRSYYKSVLDPLRVGLNFTWRFGDIGA